MNSMQEQLGKIRLKGALPKSEPAEKAAACDNVIVDLKDGTAEIVTPIGNVKTILTDSDIVEFKENAKSIQRASKYEKYSAMGSHIAMALLCTAAAAGAGYQLYQATKTDSKSVL